jgi:uncharacterized protein YprB with RNaseH-like and TPR domain
VLIFSYFISLLLKGRKMLKKTFLHIRGFKNPQKEQTLWKEGILNWDELLNSAKCPKKAKANQIPDWYLESNKALEEGDIDYFADRVPKAEHYRLALACPKETMFLDIETTGLYSQTDDITIIGWSLGGRFQVIVVGRDDPGQFLSDLSKAKALATFNGKAFDMKFIQRDFPKASFPKTHADLRFISKRAGFSGGQKYIERQIGLSRNCQIADGEEAVYLWYKYIRGKNTAQRKEALRQLIIYNHADIEGMKHIFDACLKKLSAQGLLPPVPLPKNPFGSLSVSLDFSNPDKFPFSLDLM